MENINIIGIFTVVVFVICSIAIMNLEFRKVDSNMDQWGNRLSCKADWHHSSKLNMFIENFCIVVLYLCGIIIIEWILGGDEFYLKGETAQVCWIAVIGFFASLVIHMGLISEVNDRKNYFC